MEQSRQIGPTVESKHGQVSLADWQSREPRARQNILNNHCRVGFDLYFANLGEGENDLLDMPDVSSGASPAAPGCQTKTEDFIAS